MDKMIKEILNKKSEGYISSDKFSLSTLGCGYWRRKNERNNI